jgi:hypothetical protein
MAGDKKPTATAEAQEQELVATAEAQEQELVEGIVARGRTVIDDEGRKGPGDTVRLPEGEIESLMRLGFLEDPNAEVAKEANGPTFERG